MYNIEITFANGNTHSLRVTRAKLADIDEYFNAECGAEVEVVSAENEPELTVDTVCHLLARNRWAKTKIVCPDGARAVVTPCGYGPNGYGDIHSVSDCEFFLIDWDFSWSGEYNVEALVKTLNRHAELKAEHEDSKAKLRKFFDDHNASGWSDDDWDCYSDWHKDVYGYRPHGRVCGEYVRPY